MIRRAGALAAAGACLVLQATPALAGEVTLTDDGFEPAEVVVAPGQTIVWSNTSTVEHTVAAEDGTWDSGPLAPGDTFSISLQREGAYAYGTADSEHSGTVVVQPDAAQTEPDEQPAADPVTPVTGVPVVALAAAAGLLLAGGGLLLRRRPR